MTGPDWVFWTFVALVLLWRGLVWLDKWRTDRDWRKHYPELWEEVHGR